MKRIENNQFWAELPFSVFSSIFYPQQKFLSHTHTYYEFFLVAEGELAQTKNGEISQLARRSLCLLYPNDEHELRNALAESNRRLGQAQKKDPVQIINCTFSEEFFKETVEIIKKDLKKAPKSWSKTLVNIPSKIWEGLIQKANALQFERHTYSVPAKQALFRSLLLDILFLLAEPEKSMATEVPAWLVKAREQMETEENFISGLASFIKLSCRTQEHLTRSMKKHYQETPTAFINQLRCKKAAQLLLYSRKETWAIMEECGFRNYPYFLKCFRKSFGLSPKQYVKLNRKAFTLK